MSEIKPTPARVATPFDEARPSWRDRFVAGCASVVVRTLAFIPAWAAYAFADCLALILVAITKRRERRKV